jgi:hypothetical protein
MLGPKVTIAKAKTERKQKLRKTRKKRAFFAVAVENPPKMPL